MGFFSDVSDFFFGDDDQETTLPPESPEDIAFRSQQRERLTESQRIEDLLFPQILGSVSGDLGLTPVYDSEGNFVRFDQREKTEKELLGEQIELAELQRQSAALKGEIPVDPLVEESLADTRRVAEERALQTLGPGWETSTPGINLMGELAQTEAGVRGAFSRGEITSSAARRDILAGRQFQEGQTTLANLLGISGIGSGLRGEASDLLAKGEASRIAQATFTPEADEGLVGSLFNVAGQAAGTAGSVGLTRYLLGG